MGFTVEDRHWSNVKTHQLVIVPTELKNMLFRHTIFHCELFLYFIFLAVCEILNFVMLAGVHALHHCMITHPPSVERFDTAGHVNFFLFKHYIPSIFNCPETPCTNLMLSMVKPIVYKHENMTSA